MLPGSTTAASPLFQIPRKSVIPIKTRDGTAIQPSHCGSIPAATTNPVIATGPAAQAKVAPASSGIVQPHAPSGSAGPARQSSLNIYASIHVPDWLLAVNESVAAPVECLQLQHFDAQKYASAIGADVHVEPLYADGTNLAAHDDPLVSLEQDNYGSVFAALLHAETRALGLQLTQHSLYHHLIARAQPDPFLYRVHVPGLRENSPRVDIGDVILVRPVSAVQSSVIVRENARWRQYLQQQGVCHPSFGGFEYHAVVWRIHRSSETVFLRIDAQALLPPRANLRFVVQSQNIEPLFRTVQMLHHGLEQSHLLNSMLFPKESNAVIQTRLSPGKFDVGWKDGCLNFEQKKAVAAILDDRYGSVPYLISGPPGTGKTRTIVETALQLLACSKKDSLVKPHLLICAPSDAAADTIALRLSHHLSKDQMLRLNGWTRTYAEVPDKLMLYSHSAENDTFSVPAFAKLMSYSVVVTTCRDANMLVEARLTNKDLAQLAFNSLKAVSPVAAESLTSSLLHWTALLLDEAAQATEPESLIPLSVILPLETLPSCPKVYPQFVLAGDEFQLGPRVASHKGKGKVGLETSLFQRLFNRPFYANHPLSRANGLRPLTRDLLPMARPAFTNLIRNYRSHPAILAVPSRLFYYDTLIPESPSLVSPDGKGSVVGAWQGWQKPIWPVLFVQNSGADEVDDILAGDGTGAGSLYNETEVNIVSELVHSLLEQIPDLAPNQIVVMSPFRAQVVRVRKRLRAAGLAAVDVGPLEAFQGLESRLVILGTTRTRRGRGTTEMASAAVDHFVRQDRERGLGIIDEPKRFNVAITRAKEGLIVIGDAATLTVTGDRCWHSFIDFCARNGLVRGRSVSCTGDDDNDDMLLGRLERMLRQQDKEMDSCQTQGVIGLRGFVEDGEEQGELVLLEDCTDGEYCDDDDDDDERKDTDDTDTDEDTGSQDTDSS